MLGVLGLPKLMFTKWNRVCAVRVVIILASSIPGQALDSFKGGQVWPRRLLLSLSLLTLPIGLSPPQRPRVEMWGCSTQPCWHFSLSTGTEEVREKPGFLSHSSRHHRALGTQRLDPVLDPWWATPTCIDNHPLILPTASLWLLFLASGYSHLW